MRKRILFIAVTIIISILFVSCAEEPEYIKITPSEAKQMMDEEDVIIVDVRRADEYSEGHIAGALLVPNETIEQKAAEELPDKDAVYLIYCRSGRRSAEAAWKLLQMGYTNVYDFGGIIDWEYGIER